MEDGGDLDRVQVGQGREEEMNYMVKTLGRRDDIRARTK